MSHSTKGPRCPNHGVPLILQGYPEGIGECPISGYEFSYDADAHNKKMILKMTALGLEEVPDWQVKQIKGEGRG